MARAPSPALFFLLSHVSEFGGGYFESSAETLLPSGKLTSSSGGRTGVSYDGRLRFSTPSNLSHCGMRSGVLLWFAADR